MKLPSRSRTPRASRIWASVPDADLACQATRASIGCGEARREALLTVLAADGPRLATVSAARPAPPVAPGLCRER